MHMVQVLPIACDGRLVGSATIMSIKNQEVYLATAAHILGSAQTIQIALPPHGGDCTLQQKYPMPSETAALEAEIATIDPFLDMAIIRSKGAQVSGVQTPPLANRANQLPVGSEVVVLGYPFAPLNSVLETWVPGHVSALARRVIAEDIEVDELVLSNVAHPGSSGSAVVGKVDGVLYGILRGSLAPPEVMKIGQVPIATDTTVTFATSSHYLTDLVSQAEKEELTNEQ